MDHLDGHQLFTGENPRDQAGRGLATLDFDGDGRTDVVIGAPGHDSLAQNDGAVYLVSGRDFESKTEFDLAQAAGANASFKIIGEGVEEQLGTGVAVGDVNGDGMPDLVLNALSGSSSRALVNVVSLSGSSLGRLDSADGRRDGVIKLDSRGDTGHWRIARSGDSGSFGSWGRDSIALVDSDGDGRSDLLVPLHNFGGPDRPSFLLLPAADVVTETSRGGAVATAEVLDESGYAFHAETNEWLLLSVASTGDVIDIDVAADHQGKLLIKGKGAPAAAAALLKILRSRPVLADRVVSATRKGQRRWDLTFDNGAFLKLPERRPDVAWHRFAALNKTHELLAKGALGFDMRTRFDFVIRKPGSMMEKSSREGGGGHLGYRG